MTKHLTLVLVPILLAGCVWPLQPEPRLTLTGTVRSTANGAAVQGATVRVRDVGPGVVCFIGCADLGSGSQKILAQGETNADGTYSLRVPPPADYAGPNCLVMRVEVSAPGFLPGVTYIRDPEEHNGSCKSLRGYADAMLTPEP